MFNPDVPIKSSNDDLLDRKQFAKQLARSILDYKQSDSFNIGLYGKWGSGKTSVLNMTVEYLLDLSKNDVNKPEIIRFNPWMFTDESQLINQFFKQLSSNFIGKKDKKKLGDQLQILGDVLGLTTFVPGVGILGTAASKLLNIFGKTLSNSALNKNIQKIKDDLVSEIKKNNIKFIILIDDIDRLSTIDIQSVFKLVQSIADFPNTIYLLAFDYDIVTRALEEVQKDNGESYLEKIIQTPFNLPVISEVKITQIFISELNKIFKNIPEDKFDTNAWAELLHGSISYYLQSLRDLARLNNTIKLKYSFLEKEINIVDFIGITLLQVFEPKIYSSLFSYKEYLCGSFNNAFSNTESQKENLKSICDMLINRSGENKQVLNILTVLFPKVREIYSNVSSSSFLVNNNGRISDKHYFDRYFSLNFDVGLSLSQVDELMLNAPENNFEKIILDINENNNSNLLLDYLDSFFKKLKEKNEENERWFTLVKHILHIWPRLINPEKNNFFSLPWEWRIRNLIQNFLQMNSDKNARKNYLKSIFEDENISLGIKSNILLMLENEHNRYLANTTRSQNNNFQISLDQLFELEQIIFQLIISSSYYDIVNDENFGFIRLLLEETKETRVQEFFENFKMRLNKTKLGTAMLISSLIGHGKGSNTSIFDTWLVNYEFIGKYCDVTNNLNRMKLFTKEADFAKLTLKQQQNIISFIVFKNFENNDMETYVTKKLIDEYVNTKGVILKKN
ncbi:KAP family P-loop NTPase fold protein [Leuconostoc mesenteroides]|uniref:KAP family P-loop NTPase fold protein n=5 Tax=Leuconostoc mesenteroides TaxID=1245 RepID=UPI0039BD7FFE